MQNYPLLAVVCFFLFIFGTWIFLANPGIKLVKMLEKANANLKTDDDDKEAEGIVTGIGGCLITIVYLLINFVVAFVQLAVIIVALALRVGNSYFGYAALAIWLIMHLITILQGKEIARDQELAKLKGDDYSAPETPFVLRLFAYVVTLYQGYLFLLFINVIK